MPTEWNLANEEARAPALHGTFVGWSWERLIPMGYERPDEAYPSNLRPGALVTPSIRLTRLLGRGGMGSVWVAEHLRLRTDVVVKFMAPEYAADAGARTRFEREATLAAQAKSPNVVQVFDHGVSDLGFPYIAMELLVGEDLGKRIEREGLIEPKLLAGVLKQACNGLSRAHQKGIVHRDIKPENVFLCDEDGEIVVKLLDFGIAKSEAISKDFAGTRTGAMMGTVYYMSPEQTMGAKFVDPRSDLWALGVVTYYALTGARPFDADAIGALVLAITQAPVVPPSVHNPALGPAIDRFMERALARPLEARFQSAKEMSEAFNAAIGLSTAPSLGTARTARASAPEAEQSASLRASAAPAQSGLGASTMAASVRSELGPRSGRLTTILVTLGMAGVLGSGMAFYLRGSAPAAEAPAAGSERSQPSTLPAVPRPDPPPAPAAKTSESHTAVAPSLPEPAVTPALPPTVSTKVHAKRPVAATSKTTTSMKGSAQATATAVEAPKPTTATPAPPPPKPTASAKKNPLQMVIQ
jgi:serine/threonine protein kinase